MAKRSTIDYTGQDAPIRVDVRRRHSTAAEGTGHSQAVQAVKVKKIGPTGVQRWIMAFWLCLLGIPGLWTVGTFLEIWFYYNTLGQALNIVLYTKALLYIGIWYVLMSTYLNRWVALMASAMCMYAGMGMCPTADGVPWITDWWTVQWSYWGFLLVSYAYFAGMVLRGPKHWILKFGG